MAIHFVRILTWMLFISVVCCLGPVPVAALAMLEARRDPVMLPRGFEGVMVTEAVDTGLATVLVGLHALLPLDDDVIL